MNCKTDKGKVLIFFVLYLFLVTACRPVSTPDKKTFRYNEPTGIASLDPAFAKNQSIIWAVHQIYNTLIVQTDAHLRKSCAVTGEILGYFRRSKRPTGFICVRTCTFMMMTFFRKDEAGGWLLPDVVYSLSRFCWIKKQPVAEPGYSTKKVEGAGSFTAPDDSTFELRRCRRHSILCWVCSACNISSIVPYEVVEKYGRDFSQSSLRNRVPFSCRAGKKGRT